MNQAPTIQGLQSVRARGLLRGIIGRSNHAEIVNALMKIRASCSEAEFKLALEVLRGNQVFKGNPIGEEFNKVFHKPIESQSKSSISTIVGRLKLHAAKLRKLTVLADEIYAQLGNADFSKSVDSCKELAKNGGASVFLLRVLYFIRNRCRDDKIVQEIDKLLSNLRSESLSSLTMVIKELSSSRTDYFKICDKVNNSDDGWVIRIAKSFIDHVPRSVTQFEETVDAFYGVSLFDAYLYLYGVRRQELPFLEPIDEVGLASNYNALTVTHLPLEKFYDYADEFVGHEYFRETFLVIETTHAFEYRTIQGATFNSFENKRARRVPFETAMLTRFYRDLHSMSDLRFESSEYKILDQAYSNTQASHFANSNALVYLLEKTDGEIEGDDIEFVKLMSTTRDIGTICPLQYIESIKNQAKTDELSLVATCLMFIRQRSHLKEHELRNIIQKMLVKQFNSNLTEFLAYINEISPAVTEHLISTSDETFLSKLFSTVKTPNKAIEERAGILDWYGEVTGDVTYTERAKNLRIDVQINKEKGTIDDSRIYVDPVRFTQWINDNVLNELTIVLETLPPTSETGVVPLNWDKVKTGLTGYDQLGSYLLQCYEEFCSNKIFGIASYLGRRIRHGTLKGTGLTDVRNFAAEAKFSRVFEQFDIGDSFGAWLKDYETMLDRLRDSFLHLNDKSKPEGLISKEFRTTNKRIIANHMANDVVKSFEAIKNGLELPYIITEYCWRLIVEDLAFIRKFLMETKAKYAVYRPDNLSQTKLRLREVQEFCQELNSLTAEKFRVISSWFNKPSIASPSADITLLFRAVVSEIKAFFPDYSPVMFIDEGEHIISGGVYFVIYDALYILIYNAAKYGKRDGILRISVYKNQGEEGASVKISIMSDIADDGDMTSTQESIRAALDGDCEDALVVEGRSGIKKLRRLQQDHYISRVDYDFEDRSIIASFDFKINY